MEGGRGREREGGTEGVREGDREGGRAGGGQEGSEGGRGGRGQRRRDLCEECACVVHRRCPSLLCVFVRACVCAWVLDVWVWVCGCECIAHRRQAFLSLCLVHSLSRARALSLSWRTLKPNNFLKPDAAGPLRTPCPVYIEANAGERPRRERGEAEGGDCGK